MGGWTSRDILSYRIQKCFWHNTLRLCTAEVIFPFKNSESVFDILTNYSNFSNDVYTKTLIHM